MPLGNASCLSHKNMGLLPPASMHFPSCTAHRCQPQADWKCFLYICSATPDPADNLPGGVVDVKDISGQDPEGWRQLSSFLMQIFGGNQAEDQASSNSSSFSLTEKPQILLLSWQLPSCSCLPNPPCTLIKAFSLTGTHIHSPLLRSAIEFFPYVCAHVSSVDAKGRS